MPIWHSSVSTSWTGWPSLATTVIATPAEGPSLGVAPSGNAYEATIEQTLDALADHLETHLDVEGLLELAR